MRAPLSGRGALLGDFGIGMAAALGGKPRRARIDALGRNRWPSAGASLDLDFVNRQAYVRGVGACTPADVITFSGGAGGTRVNGVGQIVAASGLRYDHDPVTLACKGLLIEEQRTNVLVQSAGFNTASYTRFQSTVAADLAMAPDGSMSADKLVSNVGAAVEQNVKQAATYANGVTYTASVFAKAAELAMLTMVVSSTVAAPGGSATYNLATGAAQGAPGVVAATSTYVGNGWYRLTWTFTATADILTVNGYWIDLKEPNGTGGGVYLWGAQLEAGSFATSYIPTTSAAVTRTADSAAIGDVSWLTQGAGTLAAEFDSANPTSAQAVCLSDGTIQNRIQLGANSGSQKLGFVATAGVAQVNSFGAVAAAGVAIKAAMAYADNDAKVSMDGVLIGAIGLCVMPKSISSLRVGGILATLNTLNGHVKRLRYWPRQLAEVQLLTV
jgi:hypothetical protein